jgi:Secretion system C-terminal sorting domain
LSEYSNTIALSNTRLVFSVTNPANPFSESIALRYTVPAADILTASLYNPVGELVNKQQFVATTGFNNNQIMGLQSLAAGIYTLKINYKQETYTAKLIKIQ